MHTCCWCLQTYQKPCMSFFYNLSLNYTQLIGFNLCTVSTLIKTYKYVILLNNCKNEWITFCTGSNVRYAKDKMIIWGFSGTCSSPEMDRIDRFTCLERFPGHYMGHWDGLASWIWLNALICCYSHIKPEDLSYLENNSATCLYVFQGLQMLKAQK